MCAGRSLSRRRARRKEALHVPLSLSVTPGAASPHLNLLVSRLLLDRAVGRMRKKSPARERKIKNKEKEESRKGPETSAVRIEVRASM